MENTINTTDAAASAETATQETNTEKQAAEAQASATDTKTYDEAYVAGLQQKYNAERDAAVKAAVEEAVKKERMSAEEKTKYETEQREAAITKREQEINLRELKADTVVMLSKANLPANFVDFVLGSDAESTQEKVDTLKDAFDKAVQAQVEARFKGKTPKTGSGSGQSSESDEMQDIINKALGL